MYVSIKLSIKRLITKKLQLAIKVTIGYTILFVSVVFTLLVLSENAINLLLDFQLCFSSREDS